MSHTELDRDTGTTEQEKFMQFTFVYLTRSSLVSCPFLARLQHS